MYYYKIKSIIKVLDGDTVDAVIDLGFNTFVEKRIRFFGVNAPETRTRDKKEKELGLKSKDFLKNIISSNKEVYLESFGCGKFGRVLGILYTDENKNNSINEMMLTEGHLHKKSY